MKIFRNSNKWTIAILSALSPGMGQWYNNHLHKAFVFALIHTFAIAWLCKPLLIFHHISGNQAIALIAASAIGLLSIMDAYIYSRYSKPLFCAFNSMRLLLGTIFVALFSAITAINLDFSDPILRVSRISLLMPSFPIALSAIFDPFTGMLTTLTAIVIRICLHLDTFSLSLILFCLATLNACIFSTLIGKKKYHLAGLFSIIPDFVDVSIVSDKRLGHLILPLSERLIIHWLAITFIILAVLLIKKWYLHYSALFGRALHSDSNIVSETQSIPPLYAQYAPYYNSSNTDNDLWSKLIDITNLNKAWERVRANNGAPGIDGIRIDDFAMNMEGNIDALQSILSNGQYEPLPLKSFSVPKASGGVRQLCIPTVMDRIVQQDLVQILTPIFDPIFLDCSFAYRPGKSTHDALRRVEQQLKQGNSYILDADIKSFFDTVEHNILYRLIEGKVMDSLVLDLIRRFLSSQMKGIGIPQGTATSPLYANIYLHVLDKAMTESGFLLTRYADDFVVLDTSPENTRSAFNMAHSVLNEQLHLRLNQEKTRICALKDGFIFLGYHFDESGKRPSEDAIETFSEKIQTKIDGFIQQGETPLTAFKKVRSSLRGWCNYFGMDVNQLLNDQPPEQQKITRNPSDFSEEHIQQFLKLFQGRNDVYARQWVNSEGRNGYVPIKQKMSYDAVKSHLMGEITLASYITRQDNTVGFMVIDIDCEPGQPKGIEDTHDMALRIKEFGSKHGLSIYIEESGSKGRHCWLFFANPVPAGEAQQLGKIMVMQTATRDHNIMCEIFPKQEHVSPNALGSLIKLPLGIHQVTKRRCLFLGDDGKPIPDQGGFLMRIRQVSPDSVKNAIARITGKKTTSNNTNIIISQNIQQMINGCRVLNYIINKVKEVKHLNHTERLILLYTLGHLGDEGSCFIHHIMNNCDNYNPNVTQKWLNRMEAGHPPISCAKIKDWLYDVIQEIGCSCSGNLYQGKYPSPLYYAENMDSKNDEIKANPEEDVNSIPIGSDSDRSEEEKASDIDDAWREIEKDIFSEGE